jgi:hypothetical protein
MVMEKEVLENIRSSEKEEFEPADFDDLCEGLTGEY